MGVSEGLVLGFQIGRRLAGWAGTLWISSLLSLHVLGLGVAMWIRNGRRWVDGSGPLRFEGLGSLCLL